MKHSLLYVLLCGGHTVTAGQFHYSADFSNTLYHLDGYHIVRKNPVFDGNVYLFISNYQAFDAGQHHVISTSNVNKVLVLCLLLTIETD